MINRSRVRQEKSNLAHRPLVPFSVRTVAMHTRPFYLSNPGQGPLRRYKRVFLQNEHTVDWKIFIVFIFDLTDCTHEIFFSVSTLIVKC